MAMSEPDSWKDRPFVEPLTPRELEILAHLMENRTNREIADQLVLSLNTVKWYARQQAVLAEIDADIGNVHAACRWAATQGHVGRLGRAVNALGLSYFQWHASCRAGERIFRELAEALASLEDRPEFATASVQRTRLRVLGWQASLCGLAGDLPRELRVLDESRSLLAGATLAGEDTGLERAHLAWQSGYLVLYTDPATARPRSDEALELYREIDNKWGIASALLGLGRALRGLNALEDAHQALSSSLALHQEIGNLHGESEAMSTLGGLAIRQARFEEAERLIQRSLSIIPETDRFGIAFGLGFLGSARLHTGRFVEAEASLEECLAIHKDLGMRGFQLHWRIFLGRAYLHAGKRREARAQWELMVSRAQEIRYDRGLRLGLELLGEMALVEDAFAQADEYLRESQHIQDKDAGSEREPGQWVWLGLAARGLDQRARAWQQLTTGLELAREFHQFLHLMIALAGIALLLADEGEVERAVELYALASRYPLVANSSWFEDVIGRHITAGAATLPPEMVHAARDRGQAWGLETTLTELLGGRAG
jgi:tetratricopeptide (TPR) repeat protein